MKYFSGKTFLKNTILTLCLLLLLPELVFADKPQSTGPVRVNGKTLEVKEGNFYTPYQIKGFCYEPTPKGESPDGQWRANPSIALPIYQRDFPVIKSISANSVYSIRQVTPFLMGKAKDNGIKVIAGFWIDPMDNLSDSNIRSSYIGLFRNYVYAYRGHSALLFWAIGNDSASYKALNGIDDIYSFFNAMAQEAYIAEGAAYHPVAVIHRAPANNEYIDLGPGNPADDAATSNIDIWGTVAFRRDAAGYSSFLDPTNGMNSKTAKPIWVAQWGHDVFHTTTPNTAGYEDETEQVNNNGPLAAYFINPANRGKLIGATFMEYSDEWSRALGSSTMTQEKIGLPNTNILSDSFFNFEYLGAYKIVNGGVSPNVLQPRLLADTLKQYWDTKEASANIYPGYNQIGLSILPYNLPAPYKASDFIQYMAGQGINVELIMQWDNGWKTCINNGSPPTNDFNLNVDEGIFVKAASTGVFIVSGTDIILPRAVNLKNGWNLISIPKNVSVDTGAELLEQINSQGGDARAIMIWDGSAWILTDITDPVPNPQTLSKNNRSYFIRSYSSFTWQMQGSMLKFIAGQISQKQRTPVLADE
jgi:hypothetical protein